MILKIMMIGERLKYSVIDIYIYSERLPRIQLNTETNFGSDTLAFIAKR